MRRGRKLRNSEGIPAWKLKEACTEGEGRGVAEETVGVLQTGKSRTCLGSEGNYSVERKKVVVQDRGLIDGVRSPRREEERGTGKPGFGMGKGVRSQCEAQGWQVSVEGEGFHLKALVFSAQEEAEGSRVGGMEGGGICVSSPLLPGSPTHPLILGKET